MWKGKTRQNVVFHGWYHEQSKSNQLKWKSCYIVIRDLPMKCPCHRIAHFIEQDARAVHHKWWLTEASVFYHGSKKFPQFQKFNPFLFRYIIHTNWHTTNMERGVIIKELAALFREKEYLDLPVVDSFCVESSTVHNCQARRQRGNVLPSE